MRYHEYSLGVIWEVDEHVNVTSFNALTVVLVGLVVTPVVIKNISCMHSDHRLTKKEIKGSTPGIGDTYQ